MLTNRILILDDEPAILSGLSKAIRKFCNFNGEIITVENAGNAIKALREYRFDICFFDINLPDANGVDLMEDIKDIYPGIKFVIMTASEINGSLKDRIEDHAAVFIPKPINLDLIVPFIKSTFRTGPDSVTDADIDGAEKEKRSFIRKYDFKTAGYSLNIFYSLELKTDLNANIIDISRGGAGILTFYPVYPGNVLRFISGLENVSGIVKWSRKQGTGYRAGIKFI